MSEHIADLPPHLRYGQTKGVLAAIDHFHSYDRGILWMACGTGKTVGGAVTIELRGEPLTVVFTPYIYLVKQWWKDYLEWLPTTQAKFMCVCSEKDAAHDASPLEEAKLLDAIHKTSAEEFAQLVAEAKSSKGKVQVTTNPEEIASFLKTNGRKVVFCTYASAPIFGEAQRLADIYSDFGIFDEAHMTASGDKDNYYSHALHDENVRIGRRLFTTATVRHFTRNDERIYSMDNEALYGKHVLVDSAGNPDPWTIRQAIEHEEVAPYRIVLSFVTDPKFNAGLVQLPPYRELMEDLKAKADPAEVLRLIGQAIALEKAKAKYGVKKPLGFFSNVATARLFTDVLNACKQYPQYFPFLSQSDTAVSVSTYESKRVRDAAIGHLHNSPETEINNVRLLVMGASENTIDAVSFNDPMTSNIFVVQASGRAGRYVPGKTATIIVPVMLPYFENDLAGFAQQVTKEQIKDAFRHVVAVLDGLAEMDPILQDQIMSGSSKVNGTPKIIEFDFPELFLPEVKDAIEVETWRSINPDFDFIENLHRDAAALRQFRLERFPVQENEEQEAEAAANRAQIRMIPWAKNGYSSTAERMGNLRRALKLYFEAGEIEERYGRIPVKDIRVKQIFEIYGWDRAFVLQDDFLEALKKDAAALAQYRYKKFPLQADSRKEADFAAARERIRILQDVEGFSTSCHRMTGLRKGIKAYFDAGEKPAVGGLGLTAKKVAQVFDVYGWDKNYIFQDDFVVGLREDMRILEQFRLNKVPPEADPVKEAKAKLARAEIKFVAQREGFGTVAGRMSHMRMSIRAYYETGEKAGQYFSFVINAKRVQQVFEVYGWDKEFVMRDELQERCKQDVSVLDQYRLKKIPVQDDHEKESAAAKMRAAIEIIPYGEGFNNSARRMSYWRRDFKAYYENGEHQGIYRGRFINADLVSRVCRFYGWNRDFILQDDFETSLKEDVRALESFRLEKFPRRASAEDEVQAQKRRYEIKIVGEGYGESSNRMSHVLHALKAYFEAGEKEGFYKYFTINSKRVEQIFRIYCWDKEFVLRDEFEETLKRDCGVLEGHRLKKVPQAATFAEETTNVELRAQIRILPIAKPFQSVATRMWRLRRALKAYYEAGEQEGRYEVFYISQKRVRQVYDVYGWDRNFVLGDDLMQRLTQDVAVLKKFRLEKYPPSENPDEEAGLVKLRNQIVLLPHLKGFRKSAARMTNLFNAIKLYYEADEKQGAYGAYTLNKTRVEAVLREYGWDKATILTKDNFEIALKRDVAAREQLKLEVYPKGKDDAEEISAVALREEIRVVPGTNLKFREAAQRMGSVRRAVRAYYKAGEKEGRYKSHTITAARVDLILRTYGWTKDYVCSDLPTGRPPSRNKKTRNYHAVPRLAGPFSPMEKIIHRHHSNYKIIL